MILIADSGSTKTDWRLIDDQKQIKQFSSEGINPYFQTSEEIAQILKVELALAISLINNNPSLLTHNSSLDIHFYGAGCRAEDKKEIVHKALKEHFSKGTIHIESDMLGAARSLCGDQAGIAAILGTGANTCYYDGKKIAANKISSGFILGDEGSGAHIGKTLIKAYLNDELPEDIRLRFEERYKLSKDDIIDAVYRKPMPNRFLASFSKFIYQNLKEQYMIDLVSRCFDEFFDKQVCSYPEHKKLKLNCTGSVAFYYSNILRGLALKKGVDIGTITETPIAGLTLYHLGE